VNPGSVLSLIVSLYEQLIAAKDRVAELERENAQLRETREP
jgi:hypothetical protein